MTVKVRFAPSPTGKLHIGNVRAALFNALVAVRAGGDFLLRSDDTDQARSTKEFEEQIVADLAWLGLPHTEFARQSERFGVYDHVAEYLKDEGYLYPCYETAEELDRKRKLQRARGLPPVYDRAALDLSAAERQRLEEEEGRKPHWRFKLSCDEVTWEDLVRGPVRVDTSVVSDPVLIREDGMYLYTLPSCIDDVDFAITHVIRGEDHVTNTAAQIEVFRAVIDLRGEGAIPSFAHHSLLVGADGEKLSKRLGSLTLDAMREEGIEPEAITSLLARLGTSDPVEPVLDFHQLAEGFDLGRLGRAPARFDMDELRALNAKILHMMPWSHAADRLSDMRVDETLWETVKGNISRLEEAALWRDVVEGEITPDIDEADRAVTTAAAAAVPDRELSAADWQVMVDHAKSETGAKGKALFKPLRQALTGMDHGPEMAPLFALIGAEKARARLKGKRA